jgi:hypothetical protein
VPFEIFDSRIEGACGNATQERNHDRRRFAFAGELETAGDPRLLLQESGFDQTIQVLPGRLRRAKAKGFHDLAHRRRAAGSETVPDEPKDFFARLTGRRATHDLFLSSRVKTSIPYICTVF